MKPLQPNAFLVLTFMSGFAYFTALDAQTDAEGRLRFLLVSKNAKLDVTPIATFQAEHRESCLGLCQSQSECNGINVKASVSGAFTCELLNEKHAYSLDKEVEEAGTWHFTVPQCGLCGETNWLHSRTAYFCDCRDAFTPEKDCYSHQIKKRQEDGLYKIEIDGSVVDVFCDMTVQGGGWIVIQRRIDGRQDFYLGWQDYKQGFGNKKHEYWLGNDYIHQLTAAKSHELIIALEAFSGKQVWAKYRNFSVGSEAEKYKLSLNASENDIVEKMMAYSNGQNFTTKDNDNDEKAATNCAREYTGAWWYKKCHRSNLNGKYLTLRDGNCTTGNSLTWLDWPGPGPWECLKHTRMMIRQSQA